MSYSFTLEIDADADKQAVEAAVQQRFLETSGEDQIANAAEAVRVAADAVYILKQKVARSGDKVGVSISGHANAGCEPTKGWADCTVTVSLNQHPAEKAKG